MKNLDIHILLSDIRVFYEDGLRVVFKVHFNGKVFLQDVLIYPNHTESYNPNTPKQLIAECEKVGYEPDQIEELFTMIHHHLMEKYAKEMDTKKAWLSSEGYNVGDWIG